jgi:xanthine/uracil permease
MASERGEREAAGDAGVLVEYGIDDKPDPAEAIPLGVQHLLAMFLSTVALPLVIAGAIGLGASSPTG